MVALQNVASTSGTGLDLPASTLGLFFFAITAAIALMANSASGEPAVPMLQTQYAKLVITLPDGSEIKCDRAIKTGEYIVHRGDRAYVADGNRKNVADLILAHPVTLPKGDSKFGLSCGAPVSGQPKFMLTVWVLGKSERLGN